MRSLITREIFRSKEVLENDLKVKSFTLPINFVHRLSISSSPTEASIVIIVKRVSSNFTPDHGTKLERVSFCPRQYPTC